MNPHRKSLWVKDEKKEDISEIEKNNRLASSSYIFEICDFEDSAKPTPFHFLDVTGGYSVHFLHRTLRIHQPLLTFNEVVGVYEVYGVRSGWCIRSVRCNGGSPK
jgi:hypothetical protein